jgi:phosphatidylglycerol:prolipoprotein diacylglycerol transferase
LKEGGIKTRIPGLEPGSPRVVIYPDGYRPLETPDNALHFRGYGIFLQERNLMAFVFPDLNPIALQIGPLAIRWYSLAYIAGFFGGWGVAHALVKRSGIAKPDGKQLDDFLFWMVLAVILGGRIGYILFYNFSYYMAHPSHMFKTWEGGMSFHGGLIGVAIVVAIYAWKHKISMLRLGDLAACGATVGLFFGRLANFVNGELFGRITTSKWGMVFPQGGPLPRYPSQLFEAASEGLLLFLILNGLAFFYPKIQRKYGLLFGLFLAFYGTFRFIIEFVREPDPQLGLYFNLISQGQVLCFPMILIGLGFVIYAARQNDRTV